MRRLASLLLVLLLAGSATAQTITVSPSARQLPGTNTNDSANAGNLGEYGIVAASTASDTSAGTTVTMTIASPAVITWTGNTFKSQRAGATVAGGAAILFTNIGGALPTGIVSGTTYYVIGASISGNTFQVATSCDNAIAGTAVNTSGSQSGTHSGFPFAGLTTATAKDIACIQVTAGDWTAWSTIFFNGGSTTTISTLDNYISPTTGTGTNVQGLYSRVSGGAATLFNTGQNAQAQVPGGRLSLSATTTYYLVAQCTFGASSCNAGGWLQFRRTR